MEGYISHNVFKLTKLNLEFGNCLNPVNANIFVILNRYELKFPHNANTGNEFCPWNAVTWFARNKSEFHGTNSYN